MKSGVQRLVIVLAVVAVCLSAVALAVSLTNQAPVRPVTAAPHPRLRSVEAVQMPLVLGRPYPAAAGTLESLGLRIRIKLVHQVGVPNGFVLAQVPRVGFALTPGAEVTLIVAGRAPLH